MRTVITGGLGFVGRSLAARLLGEGQEVVLFDAAAGEPLECARLETGDICDGEALRALVHPGDTVFHLAAVRGAEGERDFDRAMQVNVQGTHALLEACRAAGETRVVFASTLAVFGGSAMPETVDDSTRPNPQTTYGMTKAAGELLLADYGRRGFVDGRAGRLATVVVRPDAPAHAASGFASAVIRETLAGRDYDVPVSLDTRIPLVGVDTAVECLARLARLPSDALGDDRTINLPSISAEVRELVEAARRAGAKGRVRKRPDRDVEAVVGTWPRAARADRGLELGLPRAAPLDEIVRGYSSGKSG